MTKRMRPFHLLPKGIGMVNRYLYSLGGFFVILIVVITLVDVSGRYFGKPLPGAFEIVRLCLVTMICLTWAHTQAQKGHIALDMVFNQFPRRIQIVVSGFTSFLVLVLCGFWIWQAVCFSIKAKLDQEVTELLPIPTFPFKLIIVIGVLALSTQLFLDIQESLRQYRQVGEYKRGHNI